MARIDLSKLFSSNDTEDELAKIKQDQNEAFHALTPEEKQMWGFKEETVEAQQEHDEIQNPTSTPTLTAETKG